jgi:hypothetical protein
MIQKKRDKSSNILRLILRYFLTISLVGISFISYRPLNFVSIFFTFPLLYLFVYNEKKLPHKTNSSSKLFNKPTIYTIIFILPISFILTSNIIKSNNTQLLNWFMIAGWDHVGHIGLYWFSQVNGRILQSQDLIFDSSSTPLFHVLSPAYPQLWHFLVASVTNLIGIEPYTFSSMKVYAVFNQFIFVLFTLLSVSFLSFKIKLNTLFENIVYFIQLTLIFIWLSMYLLFGWPNWTLSVGFLIFSLRQVGKLISIEPNLDIIRRLGPYSLVLVLLYQSTWVLFMVILGLVFIAKIGLQLKHQSFKLRAHTGSEYNELYLWLVYSSLYFIFMYLDGPKGIWLDDGGGFRLSFKIYGLVILLSIALLFVTFKQNGKFINFYNIIYGVSLSIYLLLFFLTQSVGYQPYFFSKLATSILLLNLLSILSNLLDNISLQKNRLKISSGRNKRNTFLFIFMITLFYATIQIGSKNVSIYNSKFAEYFVIKLYKASYSAEIFTPPGWLEGSRIVNAIELTETQRIRPDTILLFSGDYPYLGNMWLSLLRPNPASVWTKEVEWFPDEPGRWINLINVLSSNASTEIMANAIKNTPNLFLIVGGDKEAPNTVCGDLHLRLETTETKRLFCSEEIK